MATLNARQSSVRDITRSTLLRSNAAVWKFIGDARPTIAQWLARSRQRRALREIAKRNDMHLLRDIGSRQMVLGALAPLRGRSSCSQRK